VERERKKNGRAAGEAAERLRRNIRHGHDVDDGRGEEANPAEQIAAKGKRELRAREGGRPWQWPVGGGSREEERE